MTKKYTLIYSLVIFFTLSWFFAIPRASYACTPVVFAFRHAEDLNVDLTPLGYIHAQLYIEMVTRFRIDHDYCPVGHVYSMYYKTNQGNPGTNNPFETAQPLANTTFTEPIVKIGDDPLDEHFVSHPPGNVRATKLQLREALVTNAQDGSSSAVFWSKEGLHDLGDAIAPGTDIPFDTSPRNSAYVFRFNEVLPGCNQLTQKTCFEPIPDDDVTQYIQCFNVANFALTRGTRYYCGHGISNLTTIGTGRTRFQGRICDRFAAGFKPGHEPDYYGFCE